MPMTNTPQLENLMKEGTFPVESAGGERWRILHGDTLKLVQSFKPGTFDALITDPPYASGGTKQNERNRTTNQKYSRLSTSYGAVMDRCRSTVRCLAYPVCSAMGIRRTVSM